jgi:uncharacterized membrane protein
MIAALAQYKRKIALLASLALASALCVALLLIRMVYSGVPTYRFLLWNLFLAWVPLGCALAAYSFYEKRTRLSFIFVIACAATWLLFFPNSLYVLTDLLHLRPLGNVPHWFDLIMIVSFAWAGYLLGVASLYLMQDLVSKWLGVWAGWLFVCGALSLSSIGIYFGRFLRWNSWDILLRPTSLLPSILAGLRNPLAYPRILAFSFLLSFFFISTYLVVSAFTSLRQSKAG